MGPVSKLYYFNLQPDENPFRKLNKNYHEKNLSSCTGHAGDTGMQ